VLRDAYGHEHRIVLARKQARKRQRGKA
jgi:hypothetical protein